MRSFDHVRHWVFDLDNTLYHPSARLFDQIERKMVAWLERELDVSEAEADRLRAVYWAEHGTTLNGLIAEHGIDPWSFLTDVHDIDMGVLPPAPDLAARIAALPGRRIVFTNGDAPYALRVLSARGLAEVFDDVYGIEDAGFTPKPQAPAYDRVFELAGVDPATAAMFEDDVRNLEEPHARGCVTVLVHTPSEPMAHIDHRTDDLTVFLSQVP
ncbi:MAG: pyrimidine 5'-nucleotidase [Shimia sp.]